MSLLDWLFGGNKKEEHTMGAGMYDRPTVSGMQTEDKTLARHMGHVSVADAAKDPVCGMDVDPSQAAATSVLEGTTYYFCAPGCKKAFDENPAMYLGKQGATEVDPHARHHHGGCC